MSIRAHRTPGRLGAGGGGEFNVVGGYGHLSKYWRPGFQNGEMTPDTQYRGLAGFRAAYIFTIDIELEKPNRVENLTMRQNVFHARISERLMNVRLIGTVSEYQFPANMQGPR